MSRDEDDVNVTERIKGVSDASMLRIVIPTLLGVMSCVVGALGWSVNKLSDHFDRIDVYMTTNNADTRLLRSDVDDLKKLVPQREAQIQAIRDQSQRNAWDIQALQAARK